MLNDAKAINYINHVYQIKNSVTGTHVHISSNSPYIAVKYLQNFSPINPSKLYFKCFNSSCNSYTH